MTILLVEDDKDTRQNVRKYFQALGQPVVATASYLEAVRILGKSSCFCSLCIDAPKDIRLVVTDMEMPSSIGETKSFGEHIIWIARRKLPKAIIIAMSGNDGMVRVAFEAGCDLFLLKPFRPNILKDILP